MNRTATALSGALILCAFANQAHAQQSSVPTQPAAFAIAPSSNAVLRTGTTVPLRMLEELTTKGKKLKVGQRFRLEVAEDVRVDNHVVIPAGSPATGEITEVRNKGMWGKSGRINARLLYVSVNGRNIRLSGQLDDKGTTGTAGVVGAIAVLPIAGFFTTGTSAVIAHSAPVTGFIDEDVPLALAPTAGPTPLVIAPSAPLAPAEAVPTPVVRN